VLAAVSILGAIVLISAKVNKLGSSIGSTAGDGSGAGLGANMRQSRPARCAHSSAESSCRDKAAKRCVW
jgi:hypothetical protein